MSHAFENYVDERFEVLERRVRRQRQVLVGVLVFAVGHFLATVGWFLLPPPVLRARTLEVVDSDGTVRAEIGTSNGNMGHLSLYDHKGNLQALLAENGGHSSLIFMDPSGGANLLEIYTLDDGAVVIVKDGLGQKRMELNATVKEQGLRYFDAAGNPAPARP